MVRSKKVKNAFFNAKVFLQNQFQNHLQDEAHKIEKNNIIKLCVTVAKTFIKQSNTIK